MDAWRGAGLRIGSTTGYTRALLDVVMASAARQGYAPDASVTPDQAGGGPSDPFMCYQNAILLGVFPLWACVKIGDTPSTSRRAETPECGPSASRARAMKSDFR